MRRLILAESSIGLGLVIWFAAALLLPFELGSSGAGFRALIAYVAVAGLLFTIGDILSGMTFWRGPGDMCVQAILRSLGLLVPAVLLFALGQVAAPTAESLEDDVCALGGYAEMPDAHDPADLVLDGNADCVPAR